MRIEGAIFDLDGTLLDSMPIWDTIGEDYLFSLGIKTNENLKEIFRDMSLQQAATYYQTKYGVTLSTHEIIFGVNSLIERFYLDTAPLKLGVKEFLIMLKAKGVKMCIATASDKYLADAALTRCGVRQCFSEIFTCNDVGHGKDEAVIYNIALQHLGTDKNKTIVFEDAIHAIQTAKKAAFIVAGIYDESEDNQDKVRALSDFYIVDYRKVEGIFI